MGELSTLLVVFGYGAGAGTFCTLVLALLVAVFLNTRKGREDDEDEGSLVIPYSALAGGMGGGGAPQTMTMQDVMRIRAATAAGQGGEAPSTDKKDDKTKIGGNYI